jgi:uncharacterized membrane protein
LGAALLIFERTYVATPTSIWGFVNDVFTTQAGWTLIIVGSGVGFIFAVAVLTLAVVSFPMLLDQNISAAIGTLVCAVSANLVTVGIWGFIDAALLIFSSIPFFFGLAVVMPVLGHATWHLYRKLVQP